MKATRYLLVSVALFVFALAWNGVVHGLLLGRTNASVRHLWRANLGEMTNAQIPVPPGFIVTAKAYFDISPDQTREMIDKSLEATRRGVDETRRALKSLRSSDLEDLGLGLALQRIAESAAEMSVYVVIGVT